MLQFFWKRLPTEDGGSIFARWYPKIDINYNVIETRTTYYNVTGDFYKEPIRTTMRYEATATKYPDQTTFLDETLFFDTFVDYDITVGTLQISKQYVQEKRIINDPTTTTILNVRFNVDFGSGIYENVDFVVIHYDPDGISRSATLYLKK